MSVTYVKAAKPGQTVGFFLSFGSAGLLLWVHFSCCQRLIWVVFLLPGLWIALFMLCVCRLWNV